MPRQCSGSFLRCGSLRAAEAQDFLSSNTQKTSAPRRKTWLTWTEAVFITCRGEEGAWGSDMCLRTGSIIFSLKLLIASILLSVVHIHFLSKMAMPGKKKKILPLRYILLTRGEVSETECNPLWHRASIWVSDRSAGCCVCSSVCVCVCVLTAAATHNLNWNQPLACCTWTLTPCSHVCTGGCELIPHHTVYSH